MPKFSKYLHGVASLYPTRIEAFPYWFLPADKDGYVMTPASWDEMADPQDPYLKVSYKVLSTWSKAKITNTCHGLTILVQCSCTTAHLLPLQSRLWSTPQSVDP